MELKKMYFKTRKKLENIYFFKLLYIIIFI